MIAFAIEIEVRDVHPHGRGMAKKREQLTGLIREVYPELEEPKGVQVLLKITNPLQVDADRLRSTLRRIALEEHCMGVDPAVVIDTAYVAAMALDDGGGPVQSTRIVGHSCDEGEGDHMPKNCESL